MSSLDFCWISWRKLYVVNGWETVWVVCVVCVNLAIGNLSLHHTPVVNDVVATKNIKKTRLG